MIESRQKKYYEEYGLHFMHASDEWYITAGRDFPEEERYDGYIQLENGVGMMRLFITEFTEALEQVKSNPGYLKMREEVKRTVCRDRKIDLRNHLFICRAYDGGISGTSDPCICHKE